MHNLFAPLIAERVDTPDGPRELAVVAGVSDDLWGIDVATGREIWHRRFDSTLTSEGRTDDTLCPGGLTAVPTMAQTSPGTYTIYVVSWDGRLRQVNLADGKDVVAAGAVHPGRRQALRAQPAQGRRLHRHGAGLRRADQRLLLVRPRHAGRQRVHSRRRRPVGTPRRGDRRRGPRVPRHRRRDVRSAHPAPRQRHRRRAARRHQAVPVGRLLRRAERELAVAPRPRRQHDAGRVRPPRTPVPRGHEQGMPPVAAGSRRARRRGSPHHAAHHAAHLQRPAGVRRAGHLGRARRLEGRRRHAVGARAVLGTGEPHLQGADRARAPARRRRGRVHGAAAARRLAAGAGVALARHGSRRGGRHRQRHRVRVRRGRGRLAGDAREGLGRTRRPGVWRRPEFGSRPAHRQFAEGGDVRPRRPHRQGTLVERRPDRVVEPLQRARPSPTAARTSRPSTARSTASAFPGRTDMLMRASRWLLTALACVVAGSVGLAQVGRGGTRWFTPLADAQRTSWVRADDKISVSSMAGPGFARQWTGRARPRRRRDRRVRAGRDGQWRDPLRADVGGDRRGGSRLWPRQRHRLRRVGAGARPRGCRDAAGVRRRRDGRRHAHRAARRVSDAEPVGAARRAAGCGLPHAARTSGRRRAGRHRATAGAGGSAAGHAGARCGSDGEHGRDAGDRAGTPVLRRRRRPARPRPRPAAATTARPPASSPGPRPAEPTHGARRCLGPLAWCT